MIGDKFLVRGYDNGEYFQIRDDYQPTLFVSSNKTTNYKTLDGQYVEKIKPGTVRETREFIKQYEFVDNFQVFGNERFIYQYISDKYPQDEVKFDISKIRLYTMDIETRSENGFPDVEAADQEMLLISMQDYNTKEIITWGVGAFKLKQDNVYYKQFNNEFDLLSDFIQWWIKNTPDIVTGWNIQMFDIPYLAKRLYRVLGEKTARRLSPWGLVSPKELYIKGRRHVVYDIGGITQLDYLDLYKKFTYTNRESYRLDYIAQVELGQNKLDHSEHDTFKDFYTNGWQKFVEYNIIDVELVDRLEDKMKLIELALTMAYDAKVNYNDVFYQVRMWDNIIYNYLKKRNIVIPPKISEQKDEKYAGAYVKEPKPGKYDWVVSFDLNSLYPHLIMQYNISPETLRDERHPTVSVKDILEKNLTFEMHKDNAVCANGAMYRKDKRGFLPELMEKMYNERVIFKKRMLEAKQEYEKNPTDNLVKEIARCNNIQMAKKISLNSAYGAIGNQYFRYYQLANAEAITLSGQVSIRWIENKMNAYLNKILKTEEVDYVIASDTDSIYLNLGPLVEVIYKEREKTTESIVGFLNKICEVEFEKYIESSYKALANYVNAYDQKMTMKRENIADRGIWTAKKRYILNVWDSEGVRYKEPKLKIMGLETARSSTPAYFRTKLYDAFKMIVTQTNDDLIKYIEDIKRETNSQDYSEISFPRGVNGLNKYQSKSDIYQKGTPIHVRGALLYNYYIRKNNIQNKHQMIQEGEKIKFVYLKMPNPIMENCISYFSEIPKEFGLDNYIDHNLQFDKSFLKPLENVLECIGWTSKKIVTLDRFFG